MKLLINNKLYDNVEKIIIRTKEEEICLLKHHQKTAGFGTLIFENKKINGAFIFENNLCKFFEFQSL
jgi:hypothetical protein